MKYELIMLRDEEKKIKNFLDKMSSLKKKIYDDETIEKYKETVVGLAAGYLDVFAWKNDISFSSIRDFLGEIWGIERIFQYINIDIDKAIVKSEGYVFLVELVELNMVFIERKIKNIIKKLIF